MHLKRKPKGSVILMVVVLAAIVGTAVMLMPGSLVRRRKIAVDDRERFEAHLIAGDIVEIGKYLLMYERVMFTKDPLHLKAAGTGGAATRGECLRKIWGQSYGTFRVGEGNMKDACGITGANGVYQGALELACGGGLLNPGRKKTFCPGLVRDPNLSGDMFEGMRFNQWLDRGMMTSARPGVYQLLIEMTDALKPSQQNDLFVQMYHGQKFLDAMFRSGEANGPMQAWLVYEFMSGAAAFKSAASERYVKITGKITFKGARGASHFVERSETLMLVPSTPKDFALFIPYPDLGNLVPTDPDGPKSEPTTLFSQATDISANVKVFGRTYFNGDIDNDLDELPEFNESVALSGNVRKSSGLIPGPGDLPLLKQKFKKGFVANVSAARFILDGDCAGDGPPGTAPIRISNGSNFNCRELNPPGPSGIIEYVRILSGCWDADMQVGTVRQLADVKSSMGTVGGCPPFGGNLATDFVSTGFREITASGQYAPIMASTKRLTVLGNTNIYGTIFGGHITATGASNFYSVGSLTPGMVGVGSPATLVQFNSSALTTYMGVSIAVPNLPLILVTGEEAK